MTKRYYIIFNLIILALIVYSGVKIAYKINRANEIQTDTGASTTVPETTVEQIRKPPLRSYRAITDRNLFGSSEKASEEAGDIKEEDIEGLKDTSLDLTLLGTVSGDRQSARAVIEEKGGRKQNLYKVGDSVQDAVIKKVLRGKVVLRVGEEDQILTMKDPSSTEKTSRSTSFRPRRTDTFVRPNVRSRTTGTTITVNKKDIQDSLGDMEKVSSQVWLRPHLIDGNPNGLSLSRIRRGSVFSKLGLRNGDIIQKVNEKSLNTPEDINELYNNLKSSSQISLQITRRGRPRTLSYRYR